MGYPQRQRSVLQQQHCYLCKKPRPTRTDEVGGEVYAECERRKRAIFLKHALDNGYHRREEKASSGSPAE